MTEQLVIYDSYFGNTQEIAEAIGDVLEKAVVKKVSEVSHEDLEGLKILLIGSPTRAFQPSPDINSFLKGLGVGSLHGVKAAAFDTRIPIDQTDSGFLRLMIKLFGYADKKIAKALQKAGAELALENAGFGVTDSEGPLIEGEIERAQNWAKQILQK
jgi:flavodoxin